MVNVYPFSSHQGATPKMVPVPLAQMTVPEDHYERDQTIRRALMAMAGAAASPPYSRK